MDVSTEETEIAKCLLCLNCESVEDMVSTQQELEFEAILCRHFWFTPESIQHKSVCSSCWFQVEEFDEFHQHIKRVHDTMVQKSAAKRAIKADRETEKESVPEKSIAPDVSYSNVAYNDKIFLENENGETIVLEVATLGNVLNDAELSEETTDSMQHAQEGSQEGSQEENASETSAEHKTEKETKEKEEFKCEVCDKVFEKRYILNKHMKKHITERDFECTVCGKEFKNIGSLRKHMYRHESNDKVNVCDICGKVSPNSTALRSHIQFVHTMQKTFECPICHKAFKRAFTLQITFKIQNLKFKNAGSLRKHIYRHESSDRPNICDICGKVSPTSTALKSHIQFVHMMQRSYECPVCQKAFKRELTLEEHFAVHTGNFLYSCAYCEKTFKSSANMHAHKKKYHPEEWENDRAMQTAITNIMRPRKTILLIGVLVIWVLMTYLAFMRSVRVTDGSRPRPSVANKLMLEKVQYFEQNLKSFSENRQSLYRDIISILRREEKVPSVPAQAIPIVPSPESPKSPTGEEEVEAIAKENQPAVEEEAANEVLGAPVPLAPIPEAEDGRPEVERILSKFQQRYLNDDPAFPVIPVVVFACNRISVNKCLDDLIRYRPSADQFPIIVSQDCDDEPTRNTILSYRDELTLIQQPDQSDIPVPPKEKKYKGYYKISRHYGWALRAVFRQGFDSVILVEDDLSVAPDFYEYFLGTYPILKRDKSLWCVSAWNDNGKEGLIDSTAHELLYRSDFFPGLGWMMTKDLWDELEPKWPKAFWDDWIRQPEQRKERACIRPELPRTRTFGKIGVSNGLFFDKHLKYIKLSEEFVSFTKSNLTYLVKSTYDDAFLKTVYQSKVVTLDELKRGLVMTREPIRIVYHTKEQYKRATKNLGLMDDFKSGVPRTAYRGIVSFFYNGQRVYLAPNLNWKGYDLTWS
uniref:alpha-1,3-mannosyl-glycoprotein 2-beta-N-acetylglucosaminyltransferase n=1 Tax=Anopheles dirus TaxID=7168 RepID=A0A182N7W6_9DIPT